MVLRTLWTRLSSRLQGSPADADATEPADEGESSIDEETLSYAEQVEYGVDERELADEDVILRLLVKRGGRVERETVIEETGWSSDRLAGVVEEMEADDQISAITVGRRNVICRRGFEPKGYRSHLKE